MPRSPKKRAGHRAANGLRICREHAGMQTMREPALRLGIHPEVYRRRETGAWDVPVDFWDDILAVLPEYVLGDNVLDAPTPAFFLAQRTGDLDWRPLWIAGPKLPLFWQPSNAEMVAATMREYGRDFVSRAEPFIALPAYATVLGDIVSEDDADLIDGTFYVDDLDGDIAVTKATMLTVAGQVLTHFVWDRRHADSAEAAS